MDKKKQTEEQNSATPKITRRHLLRTMGATGFAVAGMAALPSSALAGTLTSSISPPTRKAVIATEKKISVNSQLAQTILSSPDGRMLVQRFGANQIDQSTITHCTFEDTNLEAATIVIPQIHAATKNYFAFFQSNLNAFLIFEFDFAPASSIVNNKASQFTGRLGVLTASGKIVSSVVANNGKIVASGSAVVTQSNTIHAEFGVNLSCFTSCLEDQWSTILAAEDEISVACFENCAGCVVGDLPGCAICVTCAAAYVAPCVGMCWSWW